MVLGIGCVGFFSVVRKYSTSVFKKLHLLQAIRSLAYLVRPDQILSCLVIFIKLMPPVWTDVSGLNFLHAMLIDKRRRWSEQTLPYTPYAL